MRESTEITRKKFRASVSEIEFSIKAKKNTVSDRLEIYKVAARAVNLDTKRYIAADKAYAAAATPKNETRWELAKENLLVSVASYQEAGVNLNAAVDAVRADYASLVEISANPDRVAEAENIIRDYDTRLRMQGLSLDMYFKYTGLDLDKMREQARPEAERNVKMRLALEKIAVLEGIAISDEEADAELERIATENKITKEQVLEIVSADAIKEDLKVQHALDLVREKAVVTDKAPESEAKEEKKPAAKKTTTRKKPAAKKEATEEKAEAPAEEPKAE